MSIEFVFGCLSSTVCEEMVIQAKLKCLRLKVSECDNASSSPNLAETEYERCDTDSETELGTIELGEWERFWHLNVCVVVPIIFSQFFFWGSGGDTRRVITRTRLKQS